MSSQIVIFRTIPLLQALALGKNIVSPQWVNTSYEQKQFAGMYFESFNLFSNLKYVFFQYRRFRIF